MESNLIDFYLNRENWSWRGELELGSSATARFIGDGIIELLPRHEHWQLDLVLSVAVHGNETAPIEIISRLFQQLQNGSLTLHSRTLLIFANLPAMVAGKRFCDENLNRLFNGKHSDISPACPESVRAAELEQAVIRFFDAAVTPRMRVHYDLHTAIRGSLHEKFAVAPYRQGEAMDSQQQQWLAAAGVDGMVQYHETTSTFSSFSATCCDAQAFTVELGKARPFGHNQLENFAECEAMLASLLAGKAPQTDRPPMKRYQVARVINRTRPQFSLAFPDDLPNFTPFKRGELLATDGEQRCYAEQDGEVVIFPNVKVQLGHRAALIAVPLKQ